MASKANDAHNAINRRSLLTTLGKAFGAGGLILTTGRAGALALPANLEAAASLPLTTAALPISPDLIQWRGLVDDLHAFHLEVKSRYSPALGEEYHARSMVVRGVGDRITAREHTTWADCVELAELCWRSMPKEGEFVGEVTGRLSRDPKEIGRDHCVVALIEAVLAVGNGERRDPRTDQGRF